MCGILGIADSQSIDENALVKMRDTMSHRGPDDAGIWLSKDKKIGLAQRRLSIIDLSAAGHQPMSDIDGKYWITFNGEVYNFQEIRQELKKKQHCFKSHTDTEVIIESYKEWGIDCLQKFNGMFAFGLYDEQKKSLFLARDRVGKKPLYYTHSAGKFVFASELKALLKDENLAQEIDLQALNHYLTFGYIGGERCIFKAVKKLPPAHALRYDLHSRNFKIWQYWEPPVLSEEKLSETDLLEELEQLFQDAVRLRMISDVPLGAFLSGGVDSSLVVAMMSRVSGTPVKTFSIGFTEGKYNELPYAKIVANHFQTEHQEIIVKPDAFNVLPEIVRQFDEPFSDSSMIPMYYVSKATREHVTVALSGDGGDELFGGYSQYLAAQGNYYSVKFIPSFFRKAITEAAEYLPEKFIGKRQLLRLKLDPFDAFIDRSTHSYFKERYRRHILKDDVLASLGDSYTSSELSRRKYLEERKGDFLNRMLYADFKTYLPDDIMVKVDRASMMVSLETRAPLLDYRIAEFAFRKVPGSLKVRRTTSKYLLKKLANKILPSELKVNRKQGFAIPISEWFRGPLFPQIKEMILDNKSDYFNQKYIQKLLDEHKAGIDHSGRLFMLLTFSLWENNCF
ncbi:asparagine synthase (glutamine-hydrolyzing) [bacterium]|nr:MAG: asparagine synthase (glutamine-hydrolyzing) [bacterium]